MAEKTKVTFYFDVACPFAWMTSRWMCDVADTRDIEIEWKQMCLWALNENREIPDKYRKRMDLAHGPARVVAAVAQQQGSDEQRSQTLGKLYTAYGTEIHENGNKYTDDLNEIALRNAGLDESFAKYATDESIDPHLRDIQKAASALVGDDVGTPVLQVGENAFFGPVITRRPPVEEAGDIFDAAVKLGSFPYFFEMKRSRTEDPQLPALNR